MLFSTSSKHSHNNLQWENNLKFGKIRIIFFPLWYCSYSVRTFLNLGKGETHQGLHFPHAQGLITVLKGKLCFVSGVIFEIYSALFRKICRSRVIFPKENFLQTIIPQFSEQSLNSIQQIKLQSKCETGTEEIKYWIVIHESCTELRESSSHPSWHFWSCGMKLISQEYMSSCWALLFYIPHFSLEVFVFFNLAWECDE